ARLTCRDELVVGSRGEEGIVGLYEQRCAEVREDTGPRSDVRKTEIARQADVMGHVIECRGEHVHPIQRRPQIIAGVERGAVTAVSGKPVMERTQRAAGKELLPRERARQRQAALAREGKTDVGEEQGPRLAVLRSEGRVPDNPVPTDTLACVSRV